MKDLFSAPPRRPRLVTDLSRVVANYRLLALRLAREGAAPIAVLKANAYGHGALPVAAALHAAGARRFAVATLEEGLALRTVIPEGEILVLGYVPPEGAPYAAESALTLTVTGQAQAKSFSQALHGQQLRVAIKLNTGMNRWGFPTDSAHLSATVRAVCAAVSEEGLTACEIYSHLATAEEPQGAHAHRQRSRFFAAVAALRAVGLSLPAHLSASAAVLSVGACGLPLARAGLALYGYAPSGNEPRLLPAARLECPIAAAYSLAPGEAVGYGAGFVARRRERLGILPIGYADGLPRAAEGGLVRVDGVPCPFVGRISMDASAILLTGAPRAARTAVIFGEEPSDLMQLAAAADTIPYELLARLGTRIDRKYIYGKDSGTCDTE